MTFPVFAPGDILTAADMNAVGLWLVKTQTIGTTVSSVTVTGAFSADYDNYRIIVYGGSSSATAAINMTLGSTATGYYYNSYYQVYTAGTLNGESAENTTSFPRVANARTNGGAAIIDIFRPFLAANTSAQWVTTSNTTGVNGLNSRGSGHIDNTTSYTAFTLTPASGTLTGGEIKVYGLRN